MRLAYHAYDRTGRLVHETIDAADAHEAAEQLRRQGLFVTEIKAPERATAKLRGGGGWQPRPRGTAKQLALFTRQLHVLLSTGTPVVESLSALERQTRDARFRAVVADLRAQVEEGRTLADAMSQHPTRFDAVYRALVAAGEQGGKLDGMLDRLAVMTRKQMHLRSTLLGAMAYPGLLLAVCFGVMIAMLCFVLPRFSILFETLDVPLPPTTRLMFIMSGVVRGYWWLILAATLAAAGGLAAYLRTPQGRQTIDTLLVRLPVIRAVVCGLATARIVRLLGILSDSHVPLLDALDLTEHAAGNAHYRRLVSDARDAVVRGEAMSSAFRDERLISPTVYEALRSGESTGKVSVLMLNMAEFLDEENEVTMKTAASVLEPIILVGLGLVVGGMAMSMFLPLFDLAAQAGTPGG